MEETDASIAGTKLVGPPPEQTPILRPKRQLLLFAFLICAGRQELFWKLQEDNEVRARTHIPKTSVLVSSRCGRDIIGGEIQPRCSITRDGRRLLCL